MSAQHLEVLMPYRDAKTSRLTNVVPIGYRTETDDGSSHRIVAECIRDGSQDRTPELLAAAPELLEALQRIERCDFSGQTQSDGAHLAAIARAAITKATNPALKE